MGIKDERGCFVIEGRWENGRESPGAATFFEIDKIGGSLDDAKAVAQAYNDKRASPDRGQLEWIEGVFQKRRCLYANGRNLTYRISS